MKKKYVVIFAIIIIISLFIFNALCPTNLEFTTSIKDIDILSLEQYGIDSIKKKYKFEEMDIDVEVAKKIVRDSTNFRVIKIKYLFENYSERINMIDLRVDYIFSDKLKDRIIAYNNGHTVINIFLNHGETFEMDQYILISASGNAEQEILDELYKSECDVTYFTGPFIWNTGYNFKGLGKKMIKYMVKDIA